MEEMKPRVPLAIPGRRPSCGRRFRRRHGGRGKS